MALAALALSLAPAAAWADGDPASDVLPLQPLYLSADAGLGPAQEAQLTVLVRSAADAGYSIRVAVIASPIDLGSVTALWRRPQLYAQFLGQELQFVYRGPLLVVMPNGYGFYQAAKPAAGASSRAALAALPAPGATLGAAAVTAIQRLTAASGHAVMVPVVAVTTRGGGGDPVAWIAFALGLLVIAAAWGASLRARPLQRTPRV